MIKFQILSLGREVIDILKDYIILEKKVFPISFKAFIVTFFSLIDFKKLYMKCDNLLEELVEKKKNVSKLEIKNDDILKLYKESLLEYCEALEKTISILKLVYYKLYLKSKSWREFSKYSWKEYKDDLNKYELSIKNYVILGKNLNQIKDKILNKNKIIKILYSVETSNFIKQSLNKTNIKKYFNNYKDIEKVYWTFLFTGVDESVAKQVITTPELIEYYFKMKENGITDFLISGHIMTNIKNLSLR